ncbi:hypothetical protein ACFX2B_041280 [Malus domestica]
MSRKASRIMVLYIASDNHSSARQRLEWPRADLFGSDGSNSLEDILRKGFSTGAPMQELLLSRILKEKCGVFIVLDDVEKLSQIEALLGNQHSFGGGNQVIVVEFEAELHWAFASDKPSSPKLVGCLMAHVKAHNWGI